MNRCRCFLQASATPAVRTLAMLMLWAFVGVATCWAEAFVPNGPSLLSTAEPYIYHGDKARESNSLWQVALVYRSLPHVEGLFCGGTLIGGQWVLTAAHCFHNPVTCAQTVRTINFYVAHGSVSLGRRVQLESAEDVIFAPTWDCKSRRGDVALIKLSRPLESQRVKLADSGESELNLKPGATGLISGWGFTEQGTRSVDLIEASIAIVDLSVCSKAYNGTLPEKTVCAGDGVHDTCTGDSGGPLFVRSQNGEATQLGIVGFGRGCGKKEFPGVYARIAEYKEWITTQTEPKCTAADIQARRC